MKKIIITISTICCLLLPVLGEENRVIFGIAVFLWPIAVLTIIIIKLKSKREFKIDKSEKNKNKD